MIDEEDAPVSFGLDGVQSRRRRDQRRLAYAAFATSGVGGLLLGWQLFSFSQTRMIVLSVFVYGAGIGLLWFARRSDSAIAAELQTLMGSDDWDEDEPEDRPGSVQGLSVRVLAVAALAASGVFAALGYVALELVPTWIASGGKHPPASTAQSLALERSNVRTAALGVIAAFGAGLGLLMTFHGHRHQAQEAERVERDRARGRRNARLSLSF